MKRTPHTPRDVAITLAKQAGTLLLQLSEDTIKYNMKNSHDILAEGDLQSESMIVDGIRRSFPTHSILSEELGEEIHEEEYLWVIDPIDGTINFSRKIEEYAISVALCRSGQVELGVIYQPILNRLYVAERGQGAYLNDKQIFVSIESNPLHALAATDNTSKMDKRVEDFTLLTNICPSVRHVRIFGSCALHMGKIAEGKLDFYFKTSCNYWDFAAGILLVEEAGGKITDFSGAPISRNSKTIIVSNGVMHSAVMNLINQQF